MEDAIVIQQTRNWLSSVIVALNFCPFAKREMERQSIHFQVSNQCDTDVCLHELIHECQRLDENPAIETTILIFPDAYNEFYDYLDLVELGNALLIEQGYEGIYQLASFHPEYCFAGENAADAANYTNRSPYPMLHLIREDSLERALQNYPDPESIPERNIARARQQGLGAMQQLLQQCFYIDASQND